jgi:stearoyl-CoA desaturase (delta-9 desaturase)
MTTPEVAMAPDNELAGMRFAPLNTLYLLLSPIASVVGGYYYIKHEGIPAGAWVTFLFMYLATGLAITAGYHRYYSHRAYECGPVGRFLIVCFGAATMQHSVLYWASNHRYHHRHVDHEGDPYSINKGFFWAHWGWMFFEEPKNRPFKNVLDLKKDKLVMWQHRWYWAIFLAVGLALPTLIGAAFGRPLAGLFWGGLVRMVVVQQFTFSINSLAHTFGRQPHSDANTARDSWWLPFFSFGEGYHNFHHAYPSDYRNGVAWYHFDPAKWLIASMSWVGMARSLRRTALKS